MKRLDAIKAQKSIQNKPSTSSASQLCEITLPAHASEHTNESRKLNSASAMPSSVQHDTSAAQSDENEMELNITTKKRAIHEVSSEEEPTSPLPTKRTAPGPLASGQDGTLVPKGAGRGGPSKISTFCPNPPRSGGQGSSGRDRSPIRLPEGTNPLCHQNQAIKVNQRMIKIRPTKSWLTTTSSSGTVEVLGVMEKI